MKGVIKPMAQRKMQLVAVVVLAIAFSGFGAYPQQVNPHPPARPEDMSAILDAWVRHSSAIKSLYTKFRRTDGRLGWSTQEYLYELSWKDPGQAVLKIDGVERKDKTVLIEQIVWTGRDVWQYNPRKKEIEVSSMDQIGEYEVFRHWMQESWWGSFMGNQFDVIFPALSNPKDVDPLPFLLGMKASVARKQFNFELVDDSDPERLIIRATPLTAELKASYNEVLITLDREQYLPVKLVYKKGRKGKETRSYLILDARLNPSIADATFEPETPSGWKIERPGEKGNAPGMTSGSHAGSN